MGVSAIEESLDLLTDDERAMLFGAVDGTTRRDLAAALAVNLLDDPRFTANHAARGTFHEIVGVFHRDLTTREDATPMRTSIRHLEAARAEYRQVGVLAAAAHAEIAVVTGLVIAGNLATAAERLNRRELVVEVYDSGDPRATIEMAARWVTVLQETGGASLAWRKLEREVLPLSEEHEPQALTAARQYAVASAWIADTSQPKRRRHARATQALETSAKLLRASPHTLFEAVMHAHWAELHLDDGELDEAERRLKMADAQLAAIVSRNRHAEAVRRELERR